MKIILSLCMALWFTLAHLAASFGAEIIKLPPPAKKGTVSVEEALQGRRSMRLFAKRSLDLAQISQLLWAADGINNPQGKRTAPSGRAAYPIDLYLVVGERGVTNLAPGVYRYVVADQALELVAKGEFRKAVVKACNSQVWIGEAPAIVVITGDIKRSEAKNGEQGTLFTHVEAGFIGQNIFLQAGALGLGAGVAGGFKDKPLAQALKLPQADIPFLVMPVGHKE
ncbi:MAG: SagB/ThcOx family dehydrogenase [Desulfobaccales bacterium]